MSIDPCEYKVIRLRECPVPTELARCETPEHAVAYWNLHIGPPPYFNPECECFVVLMLNSRHRVKGHALISIGTVDTLLVSGREVFRTAVIVSAAAVVLMHNHPSGDPTPSEADIRATRDLVHGGKVLRIEVLDHVIIGRDNRTSLRELGYLYM